MRCPCGGAIPSLPGFRGRRRVVLDVRQAVTLLAERAQDPVIFPAEPSEDPHRRRIDGMGSERRPRGWRPPTLGTLHRSSRMDISRSLLVSTAIALASRPSADSGPIRR
jgi:hypothetical protein